MSSDCRTTPASWHVSVGFSGGLDLVVTRGWAPSGASASFTGCCGCRTGSRCPALSTSCSRAWPGAMSRRPDRGPFRRDQPASAAGLDRGRRPAPPTRGTPDRTTDDVGIAGEGRLRDRRFPRRVPQRVDAVGLSPADRGRPGSMHHVIADRRAPRRLQEFGNRLWPCSSTSLFRTPQTGDQWTWLVITIHTRLRLVRPVAVAVIRLWRTVAVGGDVVRDQERSNTGDAEFAEGRDVAVASPRQHDAAPLPWSVSAVRQGYGVGGCRPNVAVFSRRRMVNAIGRSTNRCARYDRTTRPLTVMPTRSSGWSRSP